MPLTAKKLMLMMGLGLLLAVAPMAHAADPGLIAVEQGRPVATPAPYVAMLFHRLTGQQPDFEAWAMASDAYGVANSFDKDLVRREKAAEALRAYNLITFDDPIVVNVPVKLSSYSRQRQGYLVENFKPDTFYSYNFLGRDYALVPLDLMDYQWLSFDNQETLPGINQKLVADKGEAQMYLWVVPVSADKDKPLDVSGKQYWLLSGKVKKIQIYDESGKRLIWEGISREEAAENRQHVLDLYK